MTFLNYIDANENFITKPYSLEFWLTHRIDFANRFSPFCHLFEVENQEHYVKEQTVLKQI